jgi:PncC family amidohydrolase
MMNLCSNVIKALEGKTLVTAESCTGGMIGAALTAVPGSSAIYKGGVISYTNGVKHDLLAVPEAYLAQFGAVSAPVAEAMALGARENLCADIAVSVTGLAGPGGDDFGNPVGTVYIGYSDSNHTFSEQHLLAGDRKSIREQAAQLALALVLREIQEK